MLEVVFEHSCQLVSLHTASYVFIYEKFLTIGSVSTVATHSKPMGATSAVFNLLLLPGYFLLVVGFRGKLQI